MPGPSRAPYMARVASAITEHAAEGLDRVQLMHACVYFYGEHIRLFGRRPGQDALRAGRHGPFLRSVALALKDYGDGQVPRGFCPHPRADHNPKVTALIAGPCAAFAIKGRAERNRFLLGRGSAWLAAREANNQNLCDEDVARQHAAASGCPGSRLRDIYGTLAAQPADLDDSQEKAGATA